MADEIKNAQLDVVIPEIWKAALLTFRYAKMKIGQRVMSVDGEVAKKRDQLHIPIHAVVAVNDVGSDGSTTNQAITPTESVLVVDQWREATIDLVDKAQRQSIPDFLSEIQPEMAKALAQDTDSKLAKEQTNVKAANKIGSANDVANDDLLTEAVQKLMDADIPVDEANDISWFWHTSQWPTLKKLDKFNNANLTGQAQGGMLKNAVPDIYGIPVFFTTQIESTGGARKNMLAHRQAFAWGTQKNLNVELFARTKLSQVMTTSWLYGIKTVRSDHAVVISTKA